MHEEGVDSGSWMSEEEVARGVPLVLCFANVTRDGEETEVAILVWSREFSNLLLLLCLRKIRQ